MGKELITSKQGISIMSMFIIGSSLIIGTSGEAKQDSWMAILLSVVLVTPLFILYARLISSRPGKDLFDIVIDIFGVIIGKIIIVIYTWYAIHLGALVVRNFTEFIEIASLVDTPQYIFVFFIGALCIYMVRNGIEVMGRWSEFFLPLILLLIIITVSLSIKDMDFEIIKPVLYNGFKPVFTTAYTFLSFPLAETVIFLALLPSLEKSKNSYKVYFISLLICIIMFLLVTLRNLFVLGVFNATDRYFPSYSAVRLINIGEFLQRVEITVAIVFILCGMVKISVCLLVASLGVKKIFNLEENTHITSAVGLFMFTLSCFIYKSANEMFEWLKVYKFYAIPFQIVIPIIIIIFSEYRLRHPKTVE